MTRKALAGALIALVVALVVIGFQRQPQIASTDRVPNYAFVTDILPGQRLCQANEIVPIDTAALRMTIGTFGKPGPALTVAVRAPASSAFGARFVPVTSGRLAKGWRQGVVSVPVSHVNRSVGGATVCIANRGAWPVAIAGTTPPAHYGFVDVLSGQKLLSEVRIDYMLAGRPTWFSMLVTLAKRMTVDKGTYIDWMAWIAPLLLMLGLGVVLVRVLLRAERDE